MAVDHQEAQDAIFSLLLPFWNTATAALYTTASPMLFENLDQDRPDGATWGRMSARFSTGTRSSLGGGSSARHRYTGTVYVQVFIPKNTGTKDAYTIGKALVEAIEDTGQVGNLWFRDPRIKNVGPDVDSAFYQLNVESEFTFDRTG